MRGLLTIPVPRNSIVALECFWHLNSCSQDAQLCNWVFLGRQLAAGAQTFSSRWACSLPGDRIHTVPHKTRFSLALQVSSEGKPWTSIPWESRKGLTLLTHLRLKRSRATGSYEGREWFLASPLFTCSCTFPRQNFNLRATQNFESSNFCGEGSCGSDTHLVFWGKSK